MSCIITYNNKKYTQSEFNDYFKSHFFEFAGDFLGSKQDIEGFKKFVGSNKEQREAVEKEYPQLPSGLNNEQISIFSKEILDELIVECKKNKK